MGGVLGNGFLVTSIQSRLSEGGARVFIQYPLSV